MQNNRIDPFFTLQTFKIINPNFLLKIFLLYSCPNIKFNKHDIDIPLWVYHIFEKNRLNCLDKNSKIQMPMNNLIYNLE